MGRKEYSQKEKRTFPEIKRTEVHAFFLLEGPSVLADHAQTIIDSINKTKRDPSFFQAPKVLPSLTQYHLCNVAHFRKCMGEQKTV